MVISRRLRPSNFWEPTIKTTADLQSALEEAKNLLSAESSFT